MPDKGENMGKKAKVVIVIVILFFLVGGYFFYLSNRMQDEEVVEITAVQEVLLRNLEKNYPPTPKEVVKYYSEITKSLYNESYTEEQFEALADKMLALYDEELAANNPREQYLLTLKSDVDDFAKNGYNIVSYTTSNSTDVDFSTINGRECAKLYCNYSVKKGADYVTSQEVYELRKDKETGHWKILGFQIVTE